MIQVMFRVDASHHIGTGHVMRCLSLADRLQAEGADISFLSRNLPDGLRNVLIARNYQLHDLTILSANDGVSFEGLPDAEESLICLKMISGTIDWLIVDHYDIDIEWEQRIRPLVKSIGVIDDLANRMHDCELLLDQNYYPNMQQRYNGLVPQHCLKLLGPSYVLLRPEFIEAARISKPRTSVRRVLVTFGGSDPTDETSKVLAMLEQCGLINLQFDIIVGDVNANKDTIRERCANLPNVNYQCNINNMAEVIMNADLAIGAGGASMWERAVLGLPSILIVVADNQRETADGMEAEGLVWNLGWHGTVTSRNIFKAVNELIQNKELLERFSRSTLTFMQEAVRSGKHPVVEAIMGDN